MEQLILESPSWKGAPVEQNGLATDGHGPAYQPDSQYRDSPIVGLLWGFNESGAPLVCVDNGNPVPARSTVALSSEDVGSDAVLLFERGDPNRPLVMGILCAPQAAVVRAAIDGEKLVFTADREIVFRCGEASIILTRAGKVLIRGTYVLSRSSGANRIKGAVVEIN